MRSLKQDGALAGVAYALEAGALRRRRLDESGASISFDEWHGQRGVDISWPSQDQRIPLANFNEFPYSLPFLASQLYQQVVVSLPLVEIFMLVVTYMFLMISSMMKLVVEIWLLLALPP